MSRFVYLYSSSYSWWFDTETADVVAGYMTTDDNDESLEIPLVPDSNYLVIDFDRLDEVIDDTIQCFIKLNGGEIPIRANFDDYNLFMRLQEFDYRKEIENVRFEVSKRSSSDNYYA